MSSLPGDICKLDFGVQVAGRIIDCAFSIAFDERFDNLIQATQVGSRPFPDMYTGASSSLHFLFPYTVHSGADPVRPQYVHVAKMCGGAFHNRIVPWRMPLAHAPVFLSR